MEVGLLSYVISTLLLFCTLSITITGHQKPPGQGFRSVADSDTSVMDRVIVSTSATKMGLWQGIISASILPLITVYPSL
jgi:hypothetical protein